ncbi:DNA replication/repair protein RecF [Panacibacter ginsenosidivorans]|uniref:DNA replication and repair protein RecF n=1 Tax=Panacibacter ginsenosidivorans TaxID=1813871 RepID=A0A5B8V3Z0_9BACT|nr:DNA replication and repair protein RecF [Panacibacter ginsenosidivorans]QEC65922.1 DNA replication/repair protein RecF [Panacibacter ginsenosidivorans]
MIHLNSISLTQFRNYLFHQFKFSERIIAICGKNGTGKTNMLDAIYYLCFTKSYFSKPDAQSAYQSLRGFRLEGNFLKDNVENDIVCILRETNKKEFYLNGEVCKKFSSYIGKFPCVFIAPDDVQLITEGSEIRRNFVDMIISQIEPGYLQHLIDYKKLLEERNSLLKSAAEKNYLDETLLDILDEQLVKTGHKIFETRNVFLQSFLPLVLQVYKDIAGENDVIHVNYYSQLLRVSFEELLQQNRQRDIYLQRTGYGIHKDDLEITMLELPFKNLASQGQRKSLLFALKLAEFTILKEKKGFAPLLLLDDIFEKLDDQRMNNLLHKVCIEEKGQVFITDTHKKRLEEALTKLLVTFQLLEL